MKKKARRLQAIGALGCAACLLLASCKKQPDSSPAAETPAVTESATAALTETVPASEGFPENFDEATFLREYVSLSYTLCRTPFSSPEELSRDAILEYCFRRMAIDPALPLDPAPDDNYGSQKYSVSEKVLTEYVEKTFGLKNFSYTDCYSYDAEKKVYLLPAIGYASSLENEMTILSTERDGSKLIVHTQWASENVPLINYRYTFVPNGGDFRLESLTSSDASGGKRKFFSDSAILLKDILGLPVSEMSGLSVQFVSGNRALAEAYSYYGKKRVLHLGYVDL